MDYEIVTTRQGDTRYDALIGAVRADRALMATVWSDSESRMPESSGKVWYVAVVGGVPAAWCAAETVDGVLRCTDSYERHGYRGHGLYAAVYAYRHLDAVLVAEREGMPAVTYVFAEPLALHLADGWVVTAEGDSAELDAPAHHWFELRRPADTDGRRNPAGR